MKLTLAILLLAGTVAAQEVGQDSGWQRCSNVSGPRDQWCRSIKDGYEVKTMSEEDKLRYKILDEAQVFDVPPKVLDHWTDMIFYTDRIERDREDGFAKKNGIPDCKSDGKRPCSTHSLDRINTCEDKSRFLLMSEDNRWHCISFSGGKP